MRPLRLTLLTTAAVCFTLARPANAVVGDFTFSMPQGVDPVTIAFGFSGQQFIVSGNDLLGTPLEGQGGVDFHSADGRTIQFDRIEVRSNFVGELGVDITSVIGAFRPWLGPAIVQFPSQTAVFQWRKGSALLGQALGPPNAPRREAFGLMVVNRIEPNAVNAFRQAQFTITAFGRKAPEPGAFGLGFTGGFALMLLLRNRRSKQ